MVINSGSRERETGSQNRSKASAAGLGAVILQTSAPAPITARAHTATILQLPRGRGGSTAASATGFSGARHIVELGCVGTGGKIDTNPRGGPFWRDVILSEALANFRAPTRTIVSSPKSMCGWRPKTSTAMVRSLSAPISPASDRSQTYCRNCWQRLLP